MWFIHDDGTAPTEVVEVPLPSRRGVDCVEIQQLAPLMAGLDPEEAKREGHAKEAEVRVVGEGSALANISSSSSLTLITSSNSEASRWDGGGERRQ
ncbi:hypothetical protein GW17_00037906 [Ensete ventricosum]|nr:hypothetical protein GW17_00037906 [Ensete ventricosum]RZS17345.1 hypothetical protein BHM03_00049486 [Ensete ventricosum]